MRFCLTLNIPFNTSIWLPGIDDAPLTDIEDELVVYRNNLFDFQILVWECIFPDEKYIEADLLKYRNRVDSGFVFFPDSQEKWGKAEYKEWKFDLNPWRPQGNLCTKPFRA